jgi:hypothetical protein
MRYRFNILLRAICTLEKNSLAALDMFYPLEALLQMIKPVHYRYTISENALASGFSFAQEGWQLEARS